MEKQYHMEIVEREIEKAMNAMFPHGEGRTTPARVLHWLNTVAQRAFQQGEAYTHLMTAEDVAIRLGISSRAVRKRARARGAGWNVGRDWVFLPADLKILAEPGQVGRPPKD